MRIPSNQKLLDVIVGCLTLICACAIVFAHERPFARDWFCVSTGFCPRLDGFDAWYKISYDLGIGGLTSLFFYGLLVRVPEVQHRNRIKRSLSAHYLALRKDLIRFIVGTADGSYDPAIIDELLSRDAFRDYFKEKVTPDQERWHRFLNKLDAFKVRELVTSLEIFRDEIQFVLNNVYIESDEPFEFFKRLSAAIYVKKDISPDYDDVKQLSGFLWNLLTGWDWVEGYRRRDIVQDMIEAI